MCRKSLKVHYSWRGLFCTSIFVLRHHYCSIQKPLLLLLLLFNPFFWNIIIIFVTTTLYYHGSYYMTSTSIYTRITSTYNKIAPPSSIRTYVGCKHYHIMYIYCCRMYDQSRRQWNTSDGRFQVVESTWQTEFAYIY